VAHAVSGTGHGRRESRSAKTMAIAVNLGEIAFPKRGRPCASTGAARSPASGRPGETYAFWQAQEGL
jgi:hypothetical protein